jgi:DNA-binding response OmpR family regulator
MALFRGKEVLLLEDAADLLLQIRQVLEADGALIEDTRTARSGIAAALESLPHLIIVDLNLVGAGALQFLTEVKKIPSLAKIPILVLGSAKEKEAIMKATQLGASDCLLKPFNATLLIDKIEKLLTSNPYLARKFAESERPQIRLTVPAEIVNVDESGFLIEAPVMLGRETEIKLDAPLLDQLGCANATTRSTTRAPRPAAQGGYVNEINLLGIGPKVAKAIRSFLRERAEESSHK